ncbi:LOW QUALITY PROTEIN: kinesin-like protein KIF28P [Gigantopelta aegis]|uniref:LOW QUALITY PROTEIN: kinesin-like protein KIF28P n=1 Tax=Gigantopelta aegis TaxID=1735272 RepID=UPI001B88ADC2|nr:LOW QUALITY PROTEIN: kinesin-like protein KIF28P [Gigantopelta aegis]
MSGESVKVAVRVRPFNQREIDRKAKLIIKMTNQMTMISNPDAPNEEPKKFSFDYSYWSHDGFTTTPEGILEPVPGTNYANQRTVFNDLGNGVLKNAFEGYNCSLFAYGQTGSGKSFSMVGYGPNKGIVPITCDELFKTIESNTDPNKRFEVTFSMLEIYNEQVRDLLTKDNPKGGLQVRQNPKLGMFYVENLKKVPVGSYEEIEKRTEQGTASRTVASTQMNATSSRAHTVVTITFDQIIKQENGETKKSSTMNLVDLAGSERADSTGATGDRLKEGANINKSLSALGNVISALADLSMGKKKVMVPYRDSALTKLLQNALGGNSKTIMIAALSPADINYDETLSTLRYADRAKKIRNQAVINENPLDKLIRELKEENDKLRKALEGGGMISNEAGLSPEDMQKMRKEMEEQIRSQLLANQQMLNENVQSWDEKLSAARTETNAIAQEESKEVKKRKTVPHLKNLNEDPMLSGVIFHFLDTKETAVGRKDATPLPSICLSGLSIQKQHCKLYNNKGVIEIEPVGGSSAKTKVNGMPLVARRILTNKDRVLFGSNHLYVYINPTKDDAPKDLPKEITWEFAQKEIAQAKGFATGSSEMSKEQQIAQEQILEILPMVSEVNAVSEELNKYKSFEVVLISAAAQEGLAPTKTTSFFGRKKKNEESRVMVKMKDLRNGNTWLWERGKFMNRRYMIQEMYQKYLDGEDVLSIQKEADPFWEPIEDMLIGTANAFLQSLSYALDFDDKLTITDYKAQEEGFLYINIAPCTASGKPLDEDYFVENANELKGKPFHFKITIRSADVHKVRFSKGLKVKYRVYKEDQLTETKLVTGTMTPEFNHSRVIAFSKVTQEHLEWFETGSITFLMYAKQEDSDGDPKLQKLTTRELRQMDQIGNVAASGRRGTIFGSEAIMAPENNAHVKTELVVLQRKYERLAQKEKRMQQVCEEWSKKPPEEQQFDAFFRTVSAVANSSGTRLKTRVQLLNKDSRNGHGDDDTISLFVFGEDESELAAAADENNGFVSYDKVSKHHFEYEKFPNQRFGQVNRSSSYDEDSLASVDLAPFMASEQENGVDSSVGTHKSRAKLKNGYKTGPTQKRSRSLGNDKNGVNSSGKVTEDNGKEKDGSSACSLQ